MNSALLSRARGWAEIANHAPSGDNSQPWKVSLVTESGRLVLGLSLDEATRAAPSIFDCAFSASYLSLGAFARNFALLADCEGFKLTDLREHAEQFTLTFAPADGKADTSATSEAAALIRQRTTNRLPYKKEPLDDETRSSLARLATADGLTLREYTGEAKRGLSSEFTALDQIRYRNAGLYLEFLDKLRFGSEALQSPDGLRDTTLGVPAPSLAFLRLLRALRNVRAVRAIFFIGFERIMAFFGCHFLIKSSASIFVLSGSDDSPMGWFRLGLGFESIWLEVTRRQLALQPLGTTLLIYRMQRSDQTAVFSAREQSRLREIGARFSKEFGLDPAKPLISFRIGHASKLNNTSLRRPVRIIVL